MSILYFVLLLLLITLLLIGWVVTVSCAISWYEYSNRDPLLLSRRFFPDRQWLAARLILTEIVSVLLAVCSFPFGFLPQPPLQASTPNPRPVILLHGLFFNRAAWFLLAQRLRQCGFTPITVNLPPWEDADRLARKVAETVEEALLTYDVDRVDLVGHSMGGVLARYYLQQQLDGGRKIHHCIQIGAPNGGSKLAPFALSPLGRQLMPGSDFLSGLAALPLPSAPLFTTIYSHHDNIVIPSESSLLGGAETVELEWLGHTSLLFHPDAHQAVIDALRVD